MEQTMILTEQGSDNLSFLGALNEEDQRTYDAQNKGKEESEMRKKAGDPSK